MGLKTFGLLLLEKLATTGLAPDTRCSLLELCGVWSGQAQSQTTGRDARRTTAICRPTPGDTGTAASSQTDSIDITNKFVSIEMGARDRFVHCELLVASVLSSCLHHPRQPPSSRSNTRPRADVALHLPQQISQEASACRAYSR